MERIQEALSAAVERHLRLYFAAHEGKLPPSGLYDRIIQEVERPLITHALAACRGNQLQAAKLLGVNRNTLRKKLQDLDIKARPYRKDGSVETDQATASPRLRGRIERLKKAA